MAVGTSFQRQRPGCLLLAGPYLPFTGGTLGMLLICNCAFPNGHVRVGDRVSGHAVDPGRGEQHKLANDGAGSGLKET
jgi:hypothetical protein